MDCKKKELIMQIKKSTRKILAANLGQANKYPEFSFQKAPIEIFAFDSLKESDREGLFTEGKQQCMPYTPQANYDRKREMKELPSVELENEKLKAIFYPTLGGRLASLYDKKGERELLFDNPVFQAANLAIRNAWFAGGIEWNGPLYGHSLLTCSPVYFAKVKIDDVEVLRIYEFDRVTSTSWQIDFYLPPNEAKLWIHAKAVNPEEIDKRFYWWTNIAVPVVEGTRVFASSTDEVIHHNSAQEVLRSPWPDFDGFDASYPQNFFNSNGLFFDTHSTPQPWIAVCDGEGKGLMHSSTRNLPGRKFFVWGTAQGGKRWEDYLSLKGKGSYLEIQAGITPTQVQTTEFPAKSHISWTECIAPLDIDPEAAHQNNWFAANKSVEACTKASISEAEINKMHNWMTGFEDQEVCEILQEASAWGQIFEKAVSANISSGLTFDSTPSASEKVWFDFLDTNILNDDNPECLKDFVCSDFWIDKLKYGEESYLLYLNVGIAQLQNESFDEAKQSLKKSLEFCESSFAYRNLALIHESKENITAAFNEYQQAFECSNNDMELAVEIIKFLKKHSFNTEMNSFVTNLDGDLAELPERIQLAVAEQRFEEGKIDKAEDLLLNREYATIREGETILTNLWFNIQHAKGNDTKDIPRQIDFRVISEA